MESNFFFIKDIFPKTYKHLAEAEKNVRINQAIDVRLALEALITERLKQAGQEDLFKKYGAKAGIPLNKQTLRDHISLCQDKEQLSELGWNSASPVLPVSREKEPYQFMKGKMSLDKYSFLRRYGNAKSHDGSGRNDFLKINYSTSVKALKKFYEILENICQSDFPSALPMQEFDENRMPIQGQEHLYFIDEAGVPSDAPMSRCQMEFKAHFSRSGSRAGIQYALIRQYGKQDVKKKFLLRNVDTVQKTQDEMINALPPCMVSPVEISTISNANSPFYIVAYHFQEKPQSLSCELLEKLDIKTRLSICTDLARCMADLHAMGIFQRLLSPASVYVCDYSTRGKGWNPHLVKFDFAKLDYNQGSDAVGTVLPWAIEARNKIEDERLRKYINEKDWQDERWEKADIYALGVLFCDILSGRINKNHDAMETAMGEIFDSQQLSENFAGFLEQMLDDIAENRPAAAEVQRVMEAEMRRWN